MSKIITKKILPEYFDPVYRGIKRFEIRKDEDDIQVGDILILEEWDGKDYTGRLLDCSVLYVLRDVPQFGLNDGYVLIGFLLGSR